MADISPGRPLTTSELEKLIGNEGRNSGPTLLAEAYSEARITKQTVAALIGGIWSGAEFPDRHLDQDEWRWLFDAAGFTVDGEPADRPNQPILLWRGTVPERRHDWSWTTDQTVAKKFAAGSGGRPTGRLYVVLAPPEALLCANNGRSEAEYVIDTRGLQIHEAP
ncbi:hypothetical protein J7F02_05830 [Streptomyces sp. ISL-112]|uniref:hypothetical protein n=1 Tax=unclassified Streptomyces TaxID=2593676 RepID=UPI001BE58A5C|nr:MULTISPECIES: hypothetical protein [unclassified Streptomyces]MBT2425216.1 hypothetical protein [Streptomyces sp. ISL-112]MBT2462007.1 hypothetical protein [Streptomyces sp. ISL-63]